MPKEGQMWIQQISGQKHLVTRVSGRTIYTYHNRHTFTWSHQHFNEHFRKETMLWNQ